MSDIMRPMPFAHLMNRILSEYERERTVFGVGRFVHFQGTPLPLFEEQIETPFGPAAGPNTQLAQNIIASYVAGARFFELKTVQIMDGEELSKCVNKPCILAEDECYNCEWSTELTVPQAFEEYVRAWFACKLLAREYGFGSPDGFVFNMSVGYDLAGIKSEKIDRYIEGMKDASETDVWKECTTWALANLSRFKEVDADYVKSISPVISRSITESTLHGCPPDEIERIATYLITEKGLNTYIKCNPTILGYDFARARLNQLGYDYIVFDDHHFREDLQWEDAVPMLTRLIALGKEHHVEFGVKLTNTFPVDVTRNELPSEEMYMSGRALYLLTIEAAGRISEQFDGKLRISYSGGADALNIKPLFEAGIWPVTMATTVLKPGGYTRFAQIADVLADCERNAFTGIDVDAVRTLSKHAETDAYYRKPVKPLPDRKMHRPLPLTDCFDAPCSDGCPVHQDIPAYLDAVDRGDYARALQIILDRNTLPFITGTICPHTCGNKCMRSHYESAVDIRGAKLKAAEEAFPHWNQQSPGTQRHAQRVAVIGGGPAGLSVAAFLSREGIPVTIFEKTDIPGGVVRHVIPEFRIPASRIDNDLALCLSHGAECVTGKEITDPKALLSDGFTDVVIATGAWAHGDAHLAYGEALDALAFLEKAKNDPASFPTDRKHVVVIGGGNTAMDCARAAKRLDGVEHVRLVYRRDRRNMPADEEELNMALADGVEFMELLSPVGVKDGVLTCDVMRLGAPDESGRRAPEKTGEQTTVQADCVIAAIGEKIDPAPYVAAGCEIDANGRPVLDGNLQTTVPHIYAAGDCKAGPATVVKAIADAHIVARAIHPASRDKGTALPSDREPAFRARHGNLCPLPADGAPALCDDGKDCDCGTRCLGCPVVCEACAEVCPNRANVAITVDGFTHKQIIHMDGMCNECGNCAVFCPYDGRPYTDKFTVFTSAEDFENSRNPGFLYGQDDMLTVRTENGVLTLTADEAKSRTDHDAFRLIRAILDNYRYLL